MSRKNEHQEIMDKLVSLRDTPDRDPGQAARGRAQFLLEAKQISEVPVSISWIQRLSSVFQAPQLRISTLTIAIIIGLLFVSFTTSATAASQALPNELLYPYKIWLENQRLALTIAPEKEVELHLIYAQERLAELEVIQDLDNEVDMDAILENYQQHLDSAEKILSEHQDYLEQEEIIHKLETQAPHPSSDDGEEPEHTNQEPEVTLEPESPDEEEDEGESAGEPEESDSPDDDVPSGDPDDTPESEGSGNGETPSDDSDPSGDSDEDDSDDTEEPDDPEDPDGPDLPDDDDD